MGSSKRRCVDSKTQGIESMCKKISTSHYDQITSMEDNHSRYSEVDVATMNCRRCNNVIKRYALCSCGLDNGRDNGSDAIKLTKYTIIFDRRGLNETRIYNNDPWLIMTLNSLPYHITDEYIDKMLILK